MNEIDKNYNRTFEDIKHIDENGIEFWYARELMKVLTYKDWRYFDAVIEKAKIACKNSELTDIDHFVVDNKMVEIGSGAKREQKDYKLTRYACYLIAQNANPRLKIVALAQTYFAVQTRKQEITEKEYSMLTEDEKRFYQRNLTRKGNYSLNQAAKNAGVKNFDKFHNSGYKGLYNGETADDIAKRKGLRYREDILDNMGSVELAANLFRISQTEEKLKNDSIIGLTEAETFVLERIRDGRVVLFNYLKLKYLVFKEGKEKGLFTSIVQKMMDKKKGIFNKFMLIPIIAIFMFFVTEAFKFYELRKVYMLLMIFTGIIFVGILPAMVSYAEKLEKITFARTGIAEDINFRIDRLKLSITNDYDTFKNWRNFEEFLFLLGLNQNEIERYKNCITIYKRENRLDKLLDN